MDVVTDANVNHGRTIKPVRLPTKIISLPAAAWNAGFIRQRFCFTRSAG